MFFVLIYELMNKISSYRWLETPCQKCPLLETTFYPYFNGEGQLFDGLHTIEAVSGPFTNMD